MTDSAVPPADLVEHAAFVRRLAGCLLRDDADADDAAQETLASALARPPRVGPGVRGWLAAVLRNVVRMGWRGEGRRDRRDRSAARPGTVPGAADVIAREELLRVVLEAVRSLDPASREVVLLRHYEGLPPRAIAERLGLRIESVRSRLKRAHERLRDRLDERRGGNVEGWRSGLAVVAGLDVTGRSSVPVGGIVAMGTAMKVGTGVAAAMLLGAGAWFVTTRSDDRPDDAKPLGPAVETARVPDLLAAPQAVGLRSAPSQLASPTPAIAAGPAEDRLTDEAWKALETPVAPGRIEGIVVRGTKPLAGGRARLWNEDLTTRLFSRKPLSEPRSTVPIGDDGTFAMEGIPAGKYALEFEPAGDAARITHFELGSTPDPSRRVVLALGSGGVAGRVFDRLGRPAADIVVQTSRTVGGPTVGYTFTAETRSAADGAYAIGHLPAGTYWLVAHLGADWWSARDDRSQRADVAADRVTRLDLGSDRPDALWTGVVRTAGGRAVRGPGNVMLSRKEDGGYDQMTYDAEGRFSRRVSAGTYEIRVPPLGIQRDSPPPALAVPLSIGERDLSLDIVMPGVRVSGVVRDGSSGSVLTKHTQQWVSLTPEGKDHFARQSVLLLADGTFVADGVAPGRYVVSGWPLALRDSSMHPMTIDVREGEPDVTLELRALLE